MIPALLALSAASPAAVATTEPPVLIVRTDSALRAPREIDGRMVCFIIGTRAEDALNAWAIASGVAIERLPFQEPDEMADALAVNRCVAMAIDAAEQPAGTRVVATLGTRPAATP